MNAAVAAPLPLLDPPLERSRAQGLRGGSNWCDSPVVANSVMFSLPSSTAPASLRRAMTVASYSGTNSSKTGEPPVVRIPWV